MWQCALMASWPIDETNGRIRVAESLDAYFGLDQAVVDAPKKWRFTPGTEDSHPGPVLVTIEDDFVFRPRTN